MVFLSGKTVERYLKPIVTRKVLSPLRAAVKEKGRPMGGPLLITINGRLFPSRFPWRFKHKGEFPCVAFLDISRGLPQVAVLLAVA